MRRVEIERLFDHPIEDVFRRYTDHAGWSRWAGFGEVRRVRDGSPDRDGVGCVRAFSLAPGLREEVTRFDPPHRMDYRVTRGPVPITDHHGEVVFTPEAQGCRVTWRVTFRAQIPGTGPVIERGLTWMFRAILRRLARDLG
jgi:uncharacterized protein YndB with AHSA1/START domain